MNTARKAAAVFLACLTLLLPLSAYAESDAVLKKSAFESVNTVPGLTLTTDQKSYSPYSLVLTERFQNKTRRDYDYGVQYYLEKYVDGQWYTFADPDYVAYPALGYYLAAKGSMEHALTITDSSGFHRYYGQIEPGTYRIVEQLRDEQTNEKVYLAAEFLVEDTFRYAKEPVNLRTGPSAKHAVLRELTLGERVSYIGKSGKWTLVRAG
ncbi:MAG: SH3 domain-containing protein, partial [Clostridiaceae bacterium]